MMLMRNALIVSALATLVASGVEAAPTVQATLTLGNNTQGLATDPTVAKAFVSNYDDGTLSVVDLNTLQVAATVPVGRNPRRLTVDAAKHRLYVVNETTPGTVTVVSTQTNAVVATIAVGNGPRGIDGDFQAGQVYVTNNASNTLSIVDTSSQAVVATLPVGASPASPSSNGLLRKVYVPSPGDGTVTVIDAVARTVTKTIAVGKGPNFAAIDPQHAKVYVNNVTDRTISVIDSTTDTVTKTIASGAGNTTDFGVTSAVYRRYYLGNATDGTVTIVNTDTDTVTSTATVGSAPGQVIVDANGGNVYVVNAGSNSVGYLNAATEAVLGALTVGTSPWRITDSVGRLLVLNQNGNAADSITISSEQNTFAGTAIASEWYHASFNHYFHSADEVETRVLLDGLFGEDWHRTYQFFRVWTAPGSGRLPVSRFFSTQWGTKSSHFYTANATERGALVAGTIPGWQLEADGVYYIGLADASGNCAAGTVPLYRMYNNGQGGAPNHRFTGSRTTRDQMLAQGWVGEGSGTDVVYGCTPPLAGQ